MRGQRHSDPTPEGFNWQSARLIIPYLLEYRSRVALALIALVIAKVASIWAPFLLGQAVDSLDGKASAPGLAAIGLVIGYGLARFVNVILGEIRDTLFGRVTERAMRRVGLKVFEHLHALDLDFHLERKTGGLARDIERGTDGISFLMRFFVFNILPTFLEIAVVAILLAINFGLIFGAITLGSVAIYILFSAFATEWRTGFVRAMYQADSISSTRAVDSLLNYETVKYFGNEGYEAQRYDEALANWEQARRRNRLSLFALNAGQALIVALAMTGSLSVAALHVEQQRMSLGDFVLINAFMMQLFMPLNFLGMVYREIKSSLAGIDRMFALLHLNPTIVDPHNATPLSLRAGEVSFENVEFSYQSERPIIRGVSFKVEPGERVAIVGPSGSGKSTLIKLLFRFYDPSSGRIVIDQQPIDQHSVQSVRALIGIVPQDTVLFNDSLMENIRYGRPSATNDEVLLAVKLAHLDRFVDQLPEGLDTLVGERGLKLSGGERQRVAIARTILKRPPILVFDEATSSLDSHAEAAILQAIRELAEGHTSIAIAHRLSTVVDADRIVVIEDGRVVEQGSHTVLLARNGAYAQLWARQQHQQDHKETGTVRAPAVS